MKSQEEFNIEFSGSLGRIEGKLDTLVGDHGRIAALEREQNRQWWVTAAIAPVLALLHAIARHFNVDV